MVGHVKTHCQVLTLDFWFLSYVTLKPVAAFLTLCLPVNCTPLTRPRSNVMYDMPGPVNSETFRLS